MKLRAGKIWWGLSVALLTTSGATSVTLAQNSPQKSTKKVVPASSAMYDETTERISQEIAQIQATEASTPPAPPVQNQTFTPTYQGVAQVDDTRFFQMQLGTYAGENTGINNGFMSLESRGGLFSDNGNGLYFLDGRILLNDYSNAGMNLGGGYRRYLSGPGLVVGTNMYYDHWDSGLFNFNQLGFGAEVLGLDWEVRSNIYAPIGQRSYQNGPSIGSIIGNDIFATRSYQTSLAGFDLEYGRSLMARDNFDVKGFLGTYYYTGPGVDDSLGVRGRTELALGDYTKLNLSVQNDSIFDTTVMLGAEFTLPGRGGASHAQRSVYSRMTERVRRLPNIAVTERSETRDTGLDAFFVQQLSTGTGLQTDPYGVADLMSDSNFGAGDVAFLMDGGGTITGDIVLSSPGQQIIGSPDASGVATTVLSDGTILTVDGLGGRTALAGSLTFMAGGRASGFDMATSTGSSINVLNLAADQVAYVDNVNILSSNMDGISILNSAGQFHFMGGTTGGQINGSANIGLNIINSSTDVFLGNTTIQSPGTYGIMTTLYTGNLAAEGTTTINTPGLGGINLVTTNANLTFEDLIINGGNQGLTLSDYSGDFTVTGNANISNQQFLGIYQSTPTTPQTSNLSFGSLTMNDAGGYAIYLQEHAGTFTVEGAASIDNTVSLGLLSEDSTTDFSFGSLSVTDTGTSLALINHAGDFTVEGATVLNGFQGIGIQSSNSQTNFDFGSLEIRNGVGVGVALENNAGNFNVDGAATFNDLGSGGFLARAGSSGDYTFGSVYMNNLSDHGFALDGVSSSLTVDGLAQMTNVGEYGIHLHNTTGNAQFGSLQITGTESAAIGLNNHDANFTVDGGILLSDVGNFGIVNAGGSTGNFQAGSLNVSGYDNTGISYEGATGDFIVNNGVSSTGGEFGAIFRNQTGDIRMGSYTGTNNRYGTLVLDGNTGEFDVAGALNAVNAGNGFWIDQAVQIINNNGPISMGSVNISGMGVAGVDYRNNQGDLTVDNTFTSTGFGTGLFATGNLGDINLGGIDVTGIGPGSGTGLYVANQTGNVAVTGDAEFTNTGTTGAHLAAISGNASFGSFTSSGTTGHGLFVNSVVGGLDITNDVNITSPGEHGMQILNSGETTIGGDLSVDGATETAVSLNSTGAFSVAGDTTITNSNQGILLQSMSSDVTLNNLTVTNMTANGLSMNASSGNVTITGDANFTNSGSNAIIAQNASSGNFNLNNLTVTGGNVTGSAVAMIGHTGDFTVAGDATLTNTGLNGIYSYTSSTDFSFDNLTVSGTGNNAVYLGGSTGNFTVNGDATFTNTGSHGIMAETVVGIATSSGDLSFGNLSISGTSSNGIVLHGHNGDFTVDGDATLTNTGSTGILVQTIPYVAASEGDLSFGSLNISGNSSRGVSLSGHTGDFTVEGDAIFTNTGSIGFFSESIPGVAGATGDYSFGSLTMSGNTSNGIALSNHDGNFTVTGDTSIANSGGFGMQILGGSGDFSFGDLSITGATNSGIAISQGNKGFTSTGVVDIVSPGVNGIMLTQVNGDYNFNELNISNPGNYGFVMSEFNGDLTITGGTISGIGSNKVGIFKHDSGVANITLENMLFTSDANDVFGMITLGSRDGGGSVTLNNNQVIFADGSTGTIAYRLGSYDSGIAILSGSNNTSENAVESIQLDTDANTFSGSVEIDGNDYPQAP